MSRESEIQNVVLGHFLTQWDDSATLDEIFSEDSDSILVAWEPYEYWDKAYLKNHIQTLIKNLVAIEGGN